jgi:hypothetical protein
VADHVDGLLPSENPNRSEAVIITAAAPGADAICIWKYIRQSDGSAFFNEIEPKINLIDTPEKRSEYRSIIFDGVFEDESAGHC